MINLGSIKLSTDLILAPLMDVTTPSFRQMILDEGRVGLIVTPMIFVQQIAKAPKTVLPHMEWIDKQRPSSVQIVSSGKNEADIKSALDILSSFTFDVIDLNVGCPAKHTMRSGGGGAYLRDYHQKGTINRLEQFARWTLKYSPVPVSLKTRLGYSDPNDMNKICQKFEDWGIEFLTIHGRTIDQHYRGTVDFEKMRQIQEKISIPFIANGDVKNYADFQEMKEKTGADAVMIGRAAMQNPRIFQQIQLAKESVENGESIPEFPSHLTIPEIRDFLEKNDNFISQCSNFWNTPRFRRAEMRRLAIWLIKGIPGYKKVRRRLSRIHDLIELKDYIFGHHFCEDFKFEGPNTNKNAITKTSNSVSL